MKKTILSFAFFSFSWGISQNLFVGERKISMQEFIEKNQYSLQNQGVEKTLKNALDFYVIQDFALEKKADTLVGFRQKMNEKEAELRRAFFLDEEILNSVFENYLSDRKNDFLLSYFFVKKKENDPHNYSEIYNRVISGKMPIEKAIETYGTSKKNIIHTNSANHFPPKLKTELLSKKQGEFSSLWQDNQNVIFFKIVEKRPNLGSFVVSAAAFSAQDKEKLQKIKTEAEKGGNFDHLAKKFALPTHQMPLQSHFFSLELYQVFKNLKQGQEVLSPQLIENQYYIFKIQKKIPHQNNPETKKQFLEEFYQSEYLKLAEKKMIEKLKKTPDFKENSSFKKELKSYLNSSKKCEEGDFIVSFAEKKLNCKDLIFSIKENFPLGEKNFDFDLISTEVNGLIDAFVLEQYSQKFMQKKEIQAPMQKLKEELLSEYFFSAYVPSQITPERMEKFYHQNPYHWGERAKFRAVKTTDEKIVSEIKKTIQNPKNWEILKKQWKNKIDEKNQLKVQFWEGKMEKKMGFFSENKISFSRGVFAFQDEKKSQIIVAIDEILPPEKKSLKEMEGVIRNQLFDQIVQETIAEHRKKINIKIEPEWIKNLEKKFKK